MTYSKCEGQLIELEIERFQREFLFEPDFLLLYIYEDDMYEGFRHSFYI
ncbi:MAG: hypothetical protein RBG13Loki_3455 [Promethearchaeota archaeon CR_4]|nr:MAG: hypothetical protein RBG13Loki_3455 [Candidatus Lokiarchaeota archaeon CR_4]